MSNLLYKNKILGGLAKSHIVEQKGIKIGYFGLCEEQWDEVLSPSSVEEELKIRGFVNTAKEMSKLLRN